MARGFFARRNGKDAGDRIFEAASCAPCRIRAGVLLSDEEKRKMKKPPSSITSNTIVIELRRLEALGGAMLYVNQPPLVFETSPSGLIDELTPSLGPKRAEDCERLDDAAANEAYVSNLDAGVTESRGGCTRAHVLNGALFIPEKVQRLLYSSNTKRR